MSTRLRVVTGAFGYSGKRIAHRLLARGDTVRTLTNSPHRRGHALIGRIEVAPLAFDDVDALADSLRGARTLFNTYWVRFNTRQFSFGQAVANTKRLFEAARRAGVERVVHVSITNPRPDSTLAYFRGKAELEKTLSQSGLSHAILRPAVLFGDEDILVNNIAWALRRLPVFGVFGDGAYRIQPIHVDDLAALAVEAASRADDVTIDAVGPEQFTYRGLVEALAQIIGARRSIVSVPPALGLWAARAVGWVLRDVVITRDEIKGLMAGLLAVDSEPTGTTRLTDWATQHADRLGRRYASEMRRRRDRTAAYA
jgi:NADH dehydrogenase